MATTGICGTGYSILYEYGIFKQKIVDGWQQERADNWLPGGQVWLKSHPDQAVEIRFDGEIHENWDHGFHYIQHTNYNLSLIHISEPTRRTPISYAVFCLKKKKREINKIQPFILIQL